MLTMLAMQRQRACVAKERCRCSFTTSYLQPLTLTNMRIRVKDLKNNTTREESYDKLVLSVGAVPFELPLLVAVVRLQCVVVIGRLSSRPNG